MDTATITSQGQLTLPARIRREWGLRAGAKVEFVPQPDGYLIRPSANPVSKLKGFFDSYAGPPVTVEEMDAGLAEALARDNQRVRAGRP